MLKSDFYYELPEELIAQTPIEPRNSSRLLVLDRHSGNIEHKRFYNLCDYLQQGDLLILNDSRVIPARIFGAKEGSGAVVEFLLLEQKEKDVWETLVRPGKKAKTGARFSFGGLNSETLLNAEIIDTIDGGNRLVKFEHDGNIFDILEQIGQTPLPPYITEKLSEKERYQTVYSKEAGSSAAPTAGLHFTKEMLDDIASRGVNIGYVTLHVGLGTFRPVKVSDINEHKMHSEHYYVPDETVELIANTKKEGGRIIAVGTTSCRTLESYAITGKPEGYTDIFIYPSYEFKAIDGLVTNFHLPESTLIMLVSAFAGRENVMNAYKTAIEEKYRFFSFGDAMLIV